MLENELNRSQIVRLAVAYLGLKSNKPIYANTIQIMVHCPIHGHDDNPSMGINLEDGRCHCFACGWSGSIENLFLTLTGDNLYKTLGIKNDPFSKFAREQNLDQTNQIIEIPKKKSVFVNYNPADLEPALSNSLCVNYLKERGISFSIAESMGFLYSKGTRINTTFFKNRLCIPIFENGILSSIEGRKLDKKDWGPKVLYPKNTAVDFLYDIDNLNKEDTVYGVEGLVDLAVLRSSSFFKNSTAIFGANITDRQLDQISRFKKFVYIFDLDNAGLATVKSLKESGLSNLYTLRLPRQINNFEIKDVGDLPKAGVSVDDLLQRKWLNYIQKI